VLHESVEPVLEVLVALGARAVTEMRELARLRAVGVA